MILNGTNCVAPIFFIAAVYFFKTFFIVVAVRGVHTRKAINNIIGLENQTYCFLSCNKKANTASRPELNKMHTCMYGKGSMVYTVLRNLDCTSYRLFLTRIMQMVPKRDLFISLHQNSVKIFSNPT